LKKAKSPFLAEMVDYFLKEDGRSVLVFKHVVGKPLADFVREMDGQSALDDLVTKVFAHMCLGVDKLHRKLFIHGDLSIKSFVWDAENQRVVLVDFGLDQAIINDWPTDSEVVSDSLDYQAPENKVTGLTF